MMYHWLSWNKKLALHADWTYRIENTTTYSICSRAFEDHPDILKKCEVQSIMGGEKNVRRNSKQFSGRVYLKPSQLYSLDCELARNIFMMAVSYGYLEYTNAIRDCIAIPT